MRKKLFILLTIAILGMNTVWAESYTGCVIVEHNGEETFFEAKDIQLAFDNAVDGDVIHISEGSYPYELTVKSRVKIKACANFRYDLEIPGNPSIDEPFIETNYSFQLNVKCNLQNIVFSQVYVTLGVQKGFTVDNVSFDRCNFRVDNSGELKNIKANNCIVNRIYNYPDATIQSGDFMYCNIWANCLDVPNAKYVNSFLYWNCEDCEPFTFGNNCTFERCLISANGWVIDPSQKTNCWDIDPETFSENSDYLLANGYVDADGKVIGCRGGATPYEGSEISGPSMWYNSKKQGNKLSVELHIND